jgi:tetratricopeptide (TPR) repeat protein
MKHNNHKQLDYLSEIFRQGQQALQVGLFNQAEKSFKEVIKIRPDIIEAQIALAFVYATSKQHTKATVQFKQVLKTNPQHAHSHHNLANSLYEEKSYTEAIDHYQAAIKLDKSLVDSHIHCGMTYRKVKEYELAIKCLHQALNLDNVNAKAFHVLGMLYADLEDYPRALECLENATGLAPKHAEFRVSFALILEEASLDYEAGIQYHRACEIDPNYLDSFTLYGSYLFKNLRHDEAIECFMRAETLSPQNLDIFDQLGQTYFAMGDTDAALIKFNASLQKEPNRITSLLGIEQVYQETGELDNAIEFCDKIIAVDAKQATGYILKCRVKKSKVGDGLAEHLLGFLEQEDLDVSGKTSINFALGKIFDDQNNYQQAFKHYSAANLQKNEGLNYSPEADVERFSKLIEVFDADFFKKHQHLATASNLPIFIVGMPRSATTLTEQIISSHPNVLGAGEVIFWSKAPTAMPLRLNSKTAYPECIAEISTEQAQEIAALYEQTLHKVVGKDNTPLHITDKMPHNFLNVGLIALLFPHAKIIHTKRDPIDTCLSIFFQNFNDSNHSYGYDLGNLAFHYKQYQRIMDHWHSVLPGRIMDIHYADTIADPEFWTRKLIEHIGLAWNDACLSPHKLERSVKTASHWQVRQPIYKTSVERWRNYEEFLGPLIHALKNN